MEPFSERKKKNSEPILAASSEIDSIATDVAITQSEGQDKTQSGMQGKAQPSCACCSPRRKQRSDGEYKDLIHRLNRIEGQVRGIRGMVENDAYCVDILTQVAAVNAALNSFNKVLLANHIHTCVAEDIRAGKEGAVEELVTTLQKLMK